MIPLSQHYQDFVKTPAYQKFNTEQRDFCNEFFLGKNLFLTGSAGTGKSFCLNSIVDFLYWRDFPIGKTALTGTAALHVGGSTIHSFAGIGLGDEYKTNLLAKALKNKKAKKRIETVKILIIDEISMASADLIDKLDFVFKGVRKDPRPFGGVIICAAGDALQLPPIFKGMSGDGATFFFKAKAWSAANIRKFELKTLVRQNADSAFAKALQNIRLGEEFDNSIFSDCGARKFKGDIIPIKIFSKNVDVDRINKQSLDKISGISKKYYSNDDGDFKFIEFFNKNCPAPKILELKKGAQVMLLKNLDTDSGLVNGAIGQVDGFTTTGVVVKFAAGPQEVVELNKWEAKEVAPQRDGTFKYKVVASRSQIPLKLAYATTIHRCQGQTLDCAEIDLSGAWDYGMHYVALSRVRSIEGLKLSGFNVGDIKAHPECIEFYKQN